MIENSDIQE